MKKERTAVTLRLAEMSDARGIAEMSRDFIESGLGWRYDPASIERAHLVLLAVQPTQRRRGIGRRMVDWLMESALTAGMASVHLELRADNEAARRFYRAVGFSETVLMPKYYNGREAAMRMIRVLRAPGPLPLSWRPPVLGQN